MAIAVVILVLKSETPVEPSICHLLSPGCDGRYEPVSVFTSDNGSSDGTTEIIQGRLPLVEETELLLLAEHFGFRVHEQPVEWKDDPDSRVRFFRTAWEDWKGLMRMRRSLRRGQLGLAANFQSNPIP